MKSKETAARFIISQWQLLFIILAIVFTTVARISLVVITPFVVFFLIDKLRLVFPKYIFIILGILFINLVLSFRKGFYLNYNIVNLFYTLPFLLFLFSKPTNSNTRASLSAFIKPLTFFVIINNIIGCFQYIHTPNDDYFSGLYGHFTVTQNGLSIINSILFYYYLRKFQLFKKKGDAFLFLFFGISALLGFYGAGIVIFITTFILVNFKLNTTRFIKGLVLCIGILFLGFHLMKKIAPDTLIYNQNVIKRFLGEENRPIPRKLISYKNYFQGYTSNITDFFLGSGPGSFNSRSAFIVGSPEYFNLASFIKSSKRPYYFENYAYVLWNADNTVQFQDGFMNQPFSSILAFLGEYGLIFTVLFLFFYYKQHVWLDKYYIAGKDQLLLKEFYKFCSWFLILLLIIDNYAEYPEISILIILILKLSERSIAIGQGNKEMYSKVQM